MHHRGLERAAHLHGSASAALPHCQQERCARLPPGPGTGLVWRGACMPKEWWEGRLMPDLAWPGRAWHDAFATCMLFHVSCMRAVAHSTAQAQRDTPAARHAVGRKAWCCQSGVLAHEAVAAGGPFLWVVMGVGVAILAGTVCWVARSCYTCCRLSSPEPAVGAAPADDPGAAEAPEASGVVHRCACSRVLREGRRAVPAENSEFPVLLPRRRANVHVSNVLPISE